MTAWVNALRERYVQEPLTPHALEWFERLLEALEPSPFTLEEKGRTGSGEGAGAALSGRPGQGNA